MTGAGRSDVVVVVLAAGEGSRAWPLRDKALVRLGGENLLQRHLRILCDLGVREAVVVCNDANEEELRESVGAPGLPPVCRLVRQDPGLPGMGGAVLAARSVLGATSGRGVYVTQAHDVTDPSLHAAILGAWAGDPSDGLLAGWSLPQGEYFPGGYLVLGPDGEHVDALVEKPGPEAVPAGRLVTIVAHLHPDFDRLCEAVAGEYTIGGADDHYERALSKHFGDQRYRAVRYEGEWWALKYPWHLLGITRYFLSQLDGITDEGASVSPGANVSGPVHLGRGARILWGADVRGPAWIGPGSLVGQFAQVRESYIGERCEVGVHSEVSRSYVGDGATMHAARVLDSVVAQTPAGMRGANVSAGVITANLRIDHGSIRSAVKGQLLDTGLNKFGAIIGAGAFVSIQASTMPGVKLGEGAVVFPATVVYGDVGNDSVVGDTRPGRSAPAGEA